MTTSSIDIEVARALGWTSRPVPDPNPRGELQYTWLKSPEGKEPALVPPFSTDETTAFRQIVEAMREKGWSWDADGRVPNERYSRHAFCFSFWKEDERAFRASANSLPLAICKAFLAYKAQQTTT